jgi:hypothetical protein
MATMVRPTAASRITGAPVDGSAGWAASTGGAVVGGGRGPTGASVRAAEM